MTATAGFLFWRGREEPFGKGRDRVAPLPSVRRDQRHHPGLTRSGPPAGAWIRSDGPTTTTTAPGEEREHEPSLSSHLETPTQTGRTFRNPPKKLKLILNHRHLCAFFFYARSSNSSPSPPSTPPHSLCPPPPPQPLAPFSSHISPPATLFVEPQSRGLCRRFPRSICGIRHGSLGPSQRRGCHLPHGGAGGGVGGKGEGGGLVLVVGVEEGEGHMTATTTTTPEETVRAPGGGAGVGVCGLGA